MTRTLTITAAEWASVQDGTLWLVGEGMCSLCIEGGNDHESYGVGPCTPNLPPLEFALACAPCENEDITCHCGCDGPCLICRIELVGPCPWDTNSDGDCWHCSKPGKHHTLGHAYAVGEPLLLHDWPGMGISPGMLKALAHAGPVESLVGKWAIRLEVVGS